MTTPVQYVAGAAGRKRPSRKCCGSAGVQSSHAAMKSGTMCPARESGDSRRRVSLTLRAAMNQ